MVDFPRQPDGPKPPPPPGPPHDLAVPLMGVNVRDFTVCSWHPTQDASGPATAVAIVIATQSHGDLVLRLKTPAAVDRFIAALQHHKTDVWPKG